jgi:Flp pilus assembly protein TadD
MSFASRHGMRRRPHAHTQAESREQTLVRQASRHVRRGEGRRAIVALREACMLAERDPKLWALYGGQCAREKQHEEARHALKQAIWLRERARDPRRARSLRGMLERLGA